MVNSPSGHRELGMTSQSLSAWTFSLPISALLAQVSFPPGRRPPWALPSSCMNILPIPPIHDQSLLPSLSFKCGSFKGGTTFFITIFRYSKYRTIYVQNHCVIPAMLCRSAWVMPFRLYNKPVSCAQLSWGKPNAASEHLAWPVWGSIIHLSSAHDSLWIMGSASCESLKDAWWKLRERCEDVF